MSQIFCYSCEHNHAGEGIPVCKEIQCPCPPDGFQPDKKIVEKEKALEKKDDQYYMELLARYHTIEQKVEQLILQVPGVKNKNEWHFWFSFLHYNKIFYIGDIFGVQMFHNIEKLKVTEHNINRIRRKICHEELQTVKDMDKEMRDIQTTCDNNKQALPMRFYSLQQQKKEFIANSIYMPNDLTVLRTRGIKEEVIKEYVAA